MTEENPQWKIDQEAIIKDAKDLGNEFVDKIKSVTELLWPVVSKSYLDVIKPYWAASKFLMEKARKMQRDRAKWEAEQERAKDDSKDPGYDAKRHADMQP